MHIYIYMYVCMYIYNVRVCMYSCVHCACVYMCMCTLARSLLSINRRYVCWLCYWIF